MENNKKYYIYMITNLSNNKKYIGQHYGEISDSYLGSGSIIKKAVKKYGKENFKKEILEICKDYDSMNLAEKIWIQKYNTVEDEKFYNIATGGYNSNPCAGLSEEAEKERRKKLSEAAKGEKNHFYGVHLNGEKSARWGTHHTEEPKKKMSLAKQGGKAPTARSISIFDLEGNLVKEFETQKELKIFLGLSPKSSTSTIIKYTALGKPYHNYIIKYNE